MLLSGGRGKPNLQNFEGISKSGNQSPELLGSRTLGHPGKAVRDTKFTDRAKQTSEPTAEQSFGLNPLSTLASGKLRPGSAQGVLLSALRPTPRGCSCTQLSKASRRFWCFPCPHQSHQFHLSGAVRARDVCEQPVAANI